MLYLLYVVVLVVEIVVAATTAAAASVPVLCHQCRFIHTYFECMGVGCVGAKSSCVRVCVCFCVPIKLSVMSMCRCERALGRVALPCLEWHSVEKAPNVLGGNVCVCDIHVHVCM